MKIARCAAGGAPYWALVDPDAATVRRIAGAFSDWAPAITSGAGATALRFEGEAQPLADVRLLPPIEKSNKVVIVGANYTKHLVEFGIALPPQPVAFLKSYGALIGANDPILYPALTKELDHEVELVAVIGAERVDRGDPLASILGYSVGNDVSARDVQRSGPAGIGMDLFGAKSQDRTTGVGPWIVTRDEFPAGQPKLRLTLKVNGDVRQDGSSGDMTWPVEHLIRFVDERSSLECGDIMFTGTPNGVGQATGRYLSPGDIVEASVEGVGTLRNFVERAR
jgi:2-keto-4-pentenoate hydratase/2-oxohepta-3-ene-1,7-dioic acid hydratase in catechol pathway